MIQIALNHGKVAMIDNCDYDRIRGFSWRALRGNMGVWYAASQTKRSLTHNVKRDTILMHRLILEAAIGEEVDHRNHDGLDNRRQNLRKCTHLENSRNRRAIIAFKGVQRYKNSSYFQSRIKVHGKTIFLGNYQTEEAAADAYDKAASSYFGQFACLNNHPGEVRS